MAGTIISVYRFPKAWMITIGTLILALVAVNLIFVNILFFRIPENVWGIDTGKNTYTLLQLNIFLGIFSFWGIFSLIFGIYKKRK